MPPLSQSALFFPASSAVLSCSVSGAVSITPPQALLILYFYDVTTESTTVSSIIAVYTFVGAIGVQHSVIIGSMVCAAVCTLPAIGKDEGLIQP